MNKKAKFRILNNTDAPIGEAMKRTAAMESVDQMLLVGAQHALSKIGKSALEYLDANPNWPVVELAKRLAEESHHRVSGIGLVMAIYAEAEKNASVRETAKDLLIRRIHQAYPGGWSLQGDVRPFVKIGSWEDEVCKCFANKEFAKFAAGVLSDLAIKNPPLEGWLPLKKNDPLVNRVFDKNWP